MGSNLFDTHCIVTGTRQLANSPIQSWFNFGDFYLKKQNKKNKTKQNKTKQNKTKTKNKTKQNKNQTPQNNKTKQTKKKQTNKTKQNKTKQTNKKRQTKKTTYFFLNFLSSLLFQSVGLQLFWYTLYINTGTRQLISSPHTLLIQFLNPFHNVQCF